jgi:perosamine synthetase
MIPLMKVHMPPKEELIPALSEVLYSGIVTEGEQVREFESALMEKFRWFSKPLSTNSGTSALQLAYRCCNVRDKVVLTTPMTCTATNMPILAEGGKIVWCDIDPTTGNISVEDVKSKIERYGDTIAAIAAVDFAGYPAEWTSLMKISKENNIPLVQDAAQSLGAKINNEFVGEFGSDRHYTAFSFQAIKHLTTIDGGALVASENQNRAKKLKWYGIDREAVKEAIRWHYDIKEWGGKMHMNNVNASIGLVQLRHIDRIIERHVAVGEYFNKNLTGISGLEMLRIPNGHSPSYWIYMIKVDKREDFSRMMIDNGIAVNVAHIRNDLYSCFLNEKYVINPLENRHCLMDFNDKYIAIPCGWWIDAETAIYIVDTIKRGWA